MCTTIPRGPFPLAETTRLACIDREPDGDGPELRLGFGRNHTWEPTGVTVTVTQRGTAVTVDGDRAARLQVERILASASTPPASPMPAPAIR